MRTAVPDRATVENPQKEEVKENDPERLSPQDRFRETKESMGAAAGKLKGVFTDLSKDSPGVDLTSEHTEFAQEEQALESLHIATAQHLGEVDHGGNTHKAIEPTAVKEKTEEVFDEERFKQFTQRIDALTSTSVKNFSQEERTAFVAMLYENKELLQQVLDRNEHFDAVLHSLSRIRAIAGERVGVGVGGVDVFVLSFFNDNLEKIDRGMQFGGESKVLGMDALYQLAEYGKPLNLQDIEAVNLLIKNFDSDFVAASDRGPAINVLEYIFERRGWSGYYDMKGKLMSMLNDQNPQVSKFLPVAVDFTADSFFVDSSKKTSSSVARLIAEDLTTSFGLDWIDLTKAWKDANGGKAFVGSEVQAIVSLERDRPGICQTLIKEFGIKNFSRYPEEMLIKQYDEKDNQQLPYGVVIFPKSDHNGTFGGKTGVLEQLLTGVGEQGYGVRVFEAGSKLDVARALVGSNRRYNRKISFAVIGGHGTSVSIQLGKNTGSRRNELFLSDMYGRGVQRAHELFEPHATIILFACSTGELHGIGQKMSRIGYFAGADLRVVASDKPSNPTQIVVSRNPDGTLRFDVDYDQRWKGTMNYRAGVLESSTEGQQKQAA